ncbi:MAG: L-fucose/L-arabinose isomerase family protein [Verrucomicrobiae bacterium]|nr:L-fucose/L-arabinose isomerase family protein [Verrucomicrobiae bacterium]MCX7723414.1 L-fucose/L-arabinose isomerase family protein [Verrucomicrobiae bacterium]MDW7980332.1 L-fucose/L-arabinose isomerase family protein [Verrucomicrobiales bacterium]
MRKKSNNPTLGVIYGNRDFFPDQLVAEARADIAAVFDKLGVRAIQLEPTDTKLGGVETLADARKCAELFKRHAHEIDGVLVVLPNFGDEKGVLETLKLANLNVPVLVQAYPDALHQLDVARRRDAWCGKISVCNNLVQAGIKFTLTTKHVVHPGSALFERDLKDFLAVCRVVNGLRGARLGAVGARPGAFNTVRYSEKILERHGISVTTVDLSEILAKAEKLDAAAPEVQARLDEVLNYAKSADAPRGKLVLLAKLGVVLEQWMDANDLDATAVQCWTSVQTNYGCNFCTVMSMFSERFMPSACEVDVTGTLSMYAMQLAAQAPAALVDWNNNYGEEDDKCVLFHCGNWAKSFLPEATISTAPILGTVVGEQNTWGALAGRTPAGPVTFGRITTADAEGRIRAYVAEGHLTDDPLDTFGARAVARVPGLQQLMRYVCKHGFEHHVAITISHTADVLAEALGNYMGWEVYRHPSGANRSSA